MPLFQKNQAIKMFRLGGTNLYPKISETLFPKEMLFPSYKEWHERYKFYDTGNPFSCFYQPKGK